MTTRTVLSMDHGVRNMRVGGTHYAYVMFIICDKFGDVLMIKVTAKFSRYTVYIRLYSRVQSCTLEYRAVTENLHACAHGTRTVLSMVCVICMWVVRITLASFLLLARI